MFKFRTTALTCSIFLIAAQVCLAAPNNTLLKKVKQTYKDTNQLVSTTHVTISLKKGGWTTTRTGDIHIAFNRKTNQLKIEQPGFYTVVSDKKLQMKSEQLPGQRLETSINNPITYNQLLTKLAQLMMNPKLANVALLTSDKPIQALSLNNSPNVKTIVLKNNGKALQFESEKGNVTLAIDPQSNLIKSMNVVASKQFTQRAGVDFFTINCKYDVKKHNEKLAKDAFKFDGDNLTPASSLREMVQNLQKANRKNSKTSNARQQGAKAMEGKTAPRVVLKTLDGKAFDSHKTKAKVLVLDFWATWCGPCVQHGLPELQKIYTWAQKNNKDVAVYAVNQGESDKTVKTFWDKTSYQMPVLMDKQSLVGRKYNVTAIPSTIIIANGKVQAVEVGVAPGSSKKLQQDIEKALKAAG